MIKPSLVEQSIGLTTFYTLHPGIGGQLRKHIEDFIVEEQPKKFPVDSKGNFLLVKVTAKNWETNDLIREFAKRLHISKKRITFAGTKDKRALTTQTLCFYNVTKDKINDISISDVDCTVLHKTNKRVHIGDLIGNSFTIIVRDIDETITTEDIQQILHPLQSVNGFPNFFGVQRFGGIRPITHKVGRAMVDADFEKAVSIYLTELSEFEGEDASNARKQLLETNDYKQGFHQFPHRLRFEKMLMQHLIENPRDFTGALKRLPSNLLTMFVYAFQSYLFNRMLSKRIQQGLPLNEAIEGDIILPIKTSEVTVNPLPVSKRNKDKVNKQIEQGKAVVSCILPGSDTQFADGKMGCIEQEIIDEEHVDIRDFIIPEIPVASSYGTHRAILSNFSNLSAILETDDLYPPHQKVTLSFSLRKGSYATSLLREIMKLQDMTKY